MRGLLMAKDKQIEKVERRIRLIFNAPSENQ